MIKVGDKIKCISDIYRKYYKNGDILTVRELSPIYYFWVQEGRASFDKRAENTTWIKYSKKKRIG